MGWGLGLCLCWSGGALRGDLFHQGNSGEEVEAFEFQQFGTGELKPDFVPDCDQADVANARRAVKVHWREAELDVAAEGDGISGYDAETAHSHILALAERGLGIAVLFCPADFDVEGTHTAIVLS